MSTPLLAGQIVDGLIGAGDPLCWKVGEEWTINFALAAWRLPTGGVEHGAMRCGMRLAADAKREDWYAVVPALGLVQMEVEGQDDKKLWVRHVNVLKADGELEAVRRSLLVLVKVNDAELGDLTFDRSSGSFRGHIDWNRQAVRLMIPCVDPDQSEAAVEAARSFVRDHVERDRLIKEAALEQLLELKNEVWLEEDEEPLTSKEFIQRMTVEEIQIGEGAYWSLSFDDGDLFWGHTIVIFGKTSSREIKATIEG